ncbi:MAG: chemotaxis protein CheW [Clostridia bacterium]|jgi:purine-binding chemotaxis protein CheW|nr:chemotaxis protein CheW [Clostridia bacterium]
MTNNEVKQFIIFRLSGENYGIDIQKIKTIEKTMSFARVPKAPEYVNGVINLRGEIIPVMSLRNRFGFEIKEFDNQTRIIIIDILESPIGLIVDEVKEVLSLDADSIENAQDIKESEIDDEYISGVGKVGEEIITLLNLETLIKSSFDLEEDGE